MELFCALFFTIFLSQIREKWQADFLLSVLPASWSHQLGKTGRVPNSNSIPHNCCELESIYSSFRKSSTHSHAFVRMSWVFWKAYQLSTFQFHDRAMGTFLRVLSTKKWYGWIYLAKAYSIESLNTKVEDGTWHTLKVDIFPEKLSAKIDKYCGKHCHREEWEPIKLGKRTRRENQAVWHSWQRSFEWRFALTISRVPLLVPPCSKVFQVVPRRDQEYLLNIVHKGPPGQTRTKVIIPGSLFALCFEFSASPLSRFAGPGNYRIIVPVV